MFELIVAAALARVAMASLPNIEPIMMFVIMASQVGVPPFIVAFASMILSDLVILPGPWTIYTSLSYGLVGLLAGFFKPKTRKQSAMLAAELTILYDFLTNIFFGLSMGLPLISTLIAGIPFSLLHVLSNTCICFLCLPEPLIIFRPVSSSSNQEA